MPGPVLEGQLKLDDQQFNDGLRKSTDHADKFAQTMRALFGREPVPERRAARAFIEVARGLTASHDAAEGASTVIEGLAGNLKIGGVAALGMGVLATVLIRALNAGRETKGEVLSLERETGRLVRTADFTPAAAGIETLTEQYAQLRSKEREATGQTRQFSESLHPISGMIHHLAEQFRGREHLFDFRVLAEGLSRGASISNIIKSYREAFTAPSESERKIAQARKDSAERLAQVSAKVVAASQNQLTIARAAVLSNEILAKIKVEQLDTETKIAALQKERLPQEAVDAVKEASDIRIRSLRAELSVQRILNAEELHTARVTRPGIGLTESQAMGAQLFRKQLDIQRQISVEPNATRKAELMNQFLTVRNQIERAELQQYLKSTMVSGRTSTGGGPFRGVTAETAERIQAGFERRILDRIRLNPDLRRQLDQQLGAQFTLGAPQPPATVTTPGPALGAVPAVIQGAAATTQPPPPPAVTQGAVLQPGRLSAEALVEAGMGQTLNQGGGGSTAPTPATEQPKPPESNANEITGGHTLSDIFNLIQRLWQ